MEYKYRRTLSEEEAKEALINHVNSKCCYGKRPAREMTIKTMETSSAYHYILESYGENRSLKTKTTSIHSGPEVNSLRVPGMWEVDVDYPILFTECKKKLIMPNSARIVECYSCSGRGTKTCTSCWGSGYKNNADGDQEWCWSCSGTGIEKCSVCDGDGQVKNYEQLTIFWKNNITDYVVQYTILPNEKVSKVQGALAFEEESSQLQPLTHFGDDALKLASIQLLDEHKQTIKDDVILRQRHTVRAVPVTQVHFAWKDTTDCFFVYGIENKVHVPNYPQWCCCCCVVL